MGDGFGDGMISASLLAGVNTFRCARKQMESIRKMALVEDE